MAYKLKGNRKKYKKMISKEFALFFFVMVELPLGNISKTEAKTGL